MSRRALLIGSELDDLAGVENDVAAMRKTLEARGFSVQVCLKPDATRDGIIAAYERLIADVGEDDAVVVFYSGHGAFVAPPEDGTPRSDVMNMQFIAPLDFHESTDDDFRGIASVELSVLQARLTEKTKNVVMVVDCCYSAQMSRSASLRVKGLRNVPYQRVRAHVNKLSAQGLRVDLWRSEGNPNAVRLVACGPKQSAYEYIDTAGRPIGVLTESLTMALAEAGTEKVTWAAVMDRVRQRVVDLSFSQRPEAEGPSNRLLFETTEGDLLTSLSVTPIDGAGRLRLNCAPLLAVQASDEFMIMPPGATGFDDKAKIGDLTVDRIEPLWAEGQVTFAPRSAAGPEVPIGARAFRTTVTAPRIPVRVPADYPHAATLVAALPASALVRVAEPDEQDWLAEVRVGTDGALTICDRIGPLHPPRPADAGGITQLITDLKVFAQATALRRLVGSPSCAFNAPVTIEWGRVVEGKPQPLAAAGAVLHAGDRIYVSVRNNAVVPVFISLVDIGVSGQVTVLNRASPSGREVSPGGTWTSGFDELNRVLKGARLRWPVGLDPAQGRPETVLVLVTSAPQDLSALEQPGIAQTRGNRWDVRASPLQDMIDQLATGTTREIDPEEGAGVRYDIHAIAFDLDPVPDEGQFLVDERPDPATVLVKARGGAPITLAIRLDELVIHNNRALFGGANIRVDTVVATGGRSTGRARFEAHTARFSNIRKDEALPIDRMLMFSGKAEDYVDIAVWVTRDSADTGELADLLTEELRGLEGQRMLTELGTTMLTDTRAATMAMVIGAGAFVVNVAYKLLRRAVGNSIGLYRGARLESERFGIGRHPGAGRRPVQDFSIAFTIEDAG